SSSNLVVAHFILGNTYKYKTADWVYDIKLAASIGITAFALNIGNDEWQKKQIHKAFEAVQSFNFNLFLSFDMGSIPCSSVADAPLLQDFITQFQDSASYQRINDLPLVSAFSGQECKFGQKNTDDAWNYAIKGVPSKPVYFIPAFFVDPSKFPAVMDGGFNMSARSQSFQSMANKSLQWNATWPTGDYDVNFARLTPIGSATSVVAHTWPESPPGSSHTIRLKRTTRTSSTFATIGCSQGAGSWIANRDKVDIVQFITWNDFGESHHVGPLLQDDSQPNSEAWVNGFDHQGWLDLFAYHIQAFKTGVYPTITRDRIFLWARLYPAKANASDPIGSPLHGEWSRDFLWAVVLLVAPANVVLQCASETWSLPSGLAKLKLPLETACSVATVVLRGDDSDMSSCRLDLTSQRTLRCTISMPLLRPLRRLRV
ncbi:glycosyl hydrolase family 71-domain-containing protein, partial [Mycena epipterygia]